jgi:hypothetical protein
VQAEDLALAEAERHTDDPSCLKVGSLGGVEQLVRLHDGQGLHFVVDDRRWVNQEAGVLS